MPRAPVITTPFSSPGLVGIVLSDTTFARRGYLWGFDGNVHYCFLNPKKRRFEIWKKKWHIGPFVLWGILTAIGGALGGPAGAGAALLMTMCLPLMFYKHYYKTATEQDAAVVTNGPQMMLPGNLQFDQLLTLMLVALILPAIVGAIIGAIVGTISIPIPIVGGVVAVSAPIFFTLVGGLTGINLMAFILFLLGLGSVPYGAVQTPVGVGEAAVAQPFTYFFGRDTPAFSSYLVGPNNPPAGLTWASGGLIAIVVNGASAGTIPGQVGTSYDNLVANPRPLVVWGLIPLVFEERADLREAIRSQEEAYGAEAPDGLIIVAGSDAWINAYTLNLITHGTINATATDGSQSALMGCRDDIVIGAITTVAGFQINPFDVASYRDSIQRYGFMGVPE